jgi:arylsulfatase A
MNRRQFLKQMGVTVASLNMLGCNSSSQKGTGKAPRKPNIIYIIADDLGYGDLGCYGQKTVKTPNIDRICVEGMKFTQHYSGSTVCAPSRCVLMTGLHTGHSYVRGNAKWGKEGQSPIDKNTPTISQLIKKAGYTTGGFGKWGLGGPGSGTEPNDVGFDYWYGFNSQSLAHCYYPLHLWKNKDKIILEGNKDGKCRQFSHSLIVEEALDFMKHNKDNPFFAYLPFTIPHAELIAPEEAMEVYDGKIEETSPYLDPSEPYIPDTRYNPQAKPHTAFAAMVTLMDKNIGRIMNLIEKLGIDDNTIVMFTSDNGPHHEGGADPDFFDSNGPLKGFKRDLYEGGIRVPMIARWPGNIKPNSQTDHISAFWDVLPTMCEIANITPPKNIDGISFVPTMLGEKQKQHKYLYWEFHEKGGKQAVRMGKWKAIRLGASSDPDAPLELYDLDTDIGEKNNIADKQPEIIAKMNKIMKEARTHSDRWPFFEVKINEQTNVS